jgi:pyridoxine 5-phosphate synthase
MATLFSINLNKFALLRNSRGGNMPDVLAIAADCIAHGVRGITVHPRPDERHTRVEDVVALAELVRRHEGVEFNVEGNPSERFVDLVERTRPNQVTLVPDSPDQLTSDHGWNVVEETDRLAQVTRRLHASGLRVSLFLDPAVEQVDAVPGTGAERIELYTEPYARAFGTPEQGQQLERFRAAALRARELQLGVNAGHDLNLANLADFLRRVPGVLEVSIGHAVVCEALERGLHETLERYLQIVASQA